MMTSTHSMSTLIQEREPEIHKIHTYDDKQQLHELPWVTLHMGNGKASIQDSIPVVHLSHHYAPEDEQVFVDIIRSQYDGDDKSFKAIANKQ